MLEGARAAAYASGGIERRVAPYGPNLRSRETMIDPLDHEHITGLPARLRKPTGATANEASRNTVDALRAHMARTPIGTRIYSPVVSARDCQATLSLDTRAIAGAPLSRLSGSFRHPQAEATLT